MAERVDVAVIGAGPGGYVAAIRATQLGLTVAVIERDEPGGVCGNWGCIPSKALLYDAELVAALRGAAKRGIRVGDVEVDFEAVINRSRAVAARQARGVEALFKKNGVALIRGDARLSATGLVVAGEPEVQVQAQDVILATGSREHVLAGIEVDGDVVVTSREALESTRLPSAVVVIGGGAVGVEFAYAYAAFGSRVAVVEMEPTLLPGMDPDLGTELQRAFRRQRIDVRVSTRLERIVREGDAAIVHVVGPDGESALEADRVLVAVGRRPLVDDLGLETRGIELRDGHVLVDELMRASAPHVYAIGDMVGPLQLAHAASEQGIVAAEAIAGHRTASQGIDLTSIPLCVYCQPEVAAVGLDERAAAERGIEVRVGRVPFAAVGKAAATGHRDGFVKVLVGARYGEILGVHLVGHGVTELVAEAGLAIAQETTTEEFAAVCHAHPTMSEALREAVLAADGRAINI